jgi:sensor histidine kinase regulating citrate/malate metabolism
MQSQNTALYDAMFAQIACLEAQIEHMRVYRHDLKNHLGCVLGYLEYGEPTAAEDYLRQLLHAVPHDIHQFHTGRKVVDILLSQKAELARQQNIEFECSFALEANPFVHISDYDLATLLANLLDNGIQHAGGVNRYLYLDLFYDEAGNTILRMENSCNTVPVLQQGFFVSCKADKTAHGKGMEQIRCIVEAYSGTFSWQYDAYEERFVTQCVFAAV